MPQRGFSLIEVVVVMAIMGILVGIGLPGFVTMINSNRSKSAAESITSGLRLARAEAIGRNAPMRFQLVSSLDSSCTYSTSSVFWVVTQTNQVDYGLPAKPDVGTGTCDAAAAVPAENCTACTNLPFIAHKSPGNNFPNVVVAADRAVVTFGPLGQILPTIGSGSSSLSTVNVSVPADPDAKAWRVRVTAGSGAIKFCDPALTAGSPLACS